ncbi:hypothetical protein [Fusobacterium sp. PH5-44]|uniref:hypothetical protein n=1 Tax=unclassified Fusobacterium TaxID=2648384 RepID=UPI003D215BDB
MTNLVIKGDYKGKRISINDEGINLYNSNENFEKKKDEIKNYRSIIEKSNKITSKTFLGAAIGFIVGGIVYMIIINNFIYTYSRVIYGLNEIIRLFVVLGATIITGLGAILGIMASKSNIKYIIVVEFNDGKKSLVELEENQYNKFKIMMF